MTTKIFTGVERTFFERSGRKDFTTAVPYIVVKNFPALGLLTALRFLEWVAENPEGVLSLPTGKTPEYFIKWTQKILNEWNKPAIRKVMEENGLTLKEKPSFSGLL
jgi:glucosamine-6-phosphate deaminase